jgi:MinD-like ATPase involved in chromosome partitioning or flagellar assembly
MMQSANSEDEMVTEAFSDPNSPYRGLIYNIFQFPREEGRGLAIAVTSTHPGAGTTHVVRALTAEIGRHPANRVLRIDLATLASSITTDEDAAYLAKPTWHPSVYEIASGIQVTGVEKSCAYWHASLEHRRRSIDQLADQFHYILLDCPSVRQNGEALGVASLVDGVLLVAEANRTTKRELHHAEQQIEIAGGKLYGIIFNKQRHLVPAWVRRFF